MRVIRGFIVLLAAVLATASCSSDAPPTKPDKPTTAAKPKAIEVKDAVFVLNPDKTATLSAKVVNQAGGSYGLSYVPDVFTAGNEDDRLNVRFFFNSASFSKGQQSTIGDFSDGIQIRLAPAPSVGTKVTVDLGFSPTEDAKDEDPMLADVSVKLDVPVVARTSANYSVIGTRPNTAITIKAGKIFVIPGQKKAYLDAKVISSIDDVAWELPTAVDADGKPVEYRHQTATGGPYGVVADESRVSRMGYPPYTTSETEGGDADYFDAKDVTIGEKITVTIPFMSGDVVGVFTVVRG